MNVAEGAAGTHVPGALSGLEFADDTARLLFWRKYIELGSVLSVLIAGSSLLYLMATPERPHRAMLYLVVAAVALASGGALALGRKVAGTSRQLPFLLVWSAASICYVVVAASMDGGINSDLVWLLVLPVVYSGIGYPLAIVRWIVITAQLAVLFVMVVGHDFDGAAWYRFTFVLNFNIMLVAAASNRHRFESGERAMTAIATHDGLTGCLNRGAFLDRVENECLRAHRNGMPVSVLIADVDGFKEINDGFGHQAGDEALRALVRSLLQGMRATDSLGRIGGDEFAILLPEAGEAEAQVQAQRLIVAVRGVPCPTQLTISIGGATRAGGSAAVDALIACADAALYQAKAAGRDRYERWATATG